MTIILKYPHPISLLISMDNGINQGGILTVILASRMTGNPQISGEISGQNHAPFMSQMGSGQNNALFMSRMGFYQ